MDRKNNKGFSLVEMVIIIFIMVVVTVAAGSMMLNWKGTYLTDCAKKIDTGLSAAKVQCMNSDSNGMIITYDSSEECYFMEVYGGEKERLGDKDIKISYKLTGETSYKAVTESTNLQIAYYRSTGGFKEQSIDASGTKLYCEEIKIERRGKAAKIALEKSTGNHYVVK